MPIIEIETFEGEERPTKPQKQAKTSGISPKYGFDISWATILINYLYLVAKDSFLERTWVSHEIWYDDEQDKFLTKDRLVGLVRNTVSDEDVFKAIELLQKGLDIETKKQSLLEEYADAVNYFHNDPKIDGKGIFVKTGPLSKKYFTQAELDEMKEKYLTKKTLKNLQIL